jgi:hypothetical protein
LTDEILHYLGTAKNNLETNFITRAHRRAAFEERQRLGKNNFFDGLNAKNKALFNRVKACGDHPEDCLGSGILDTVDCFYEVFEEYPNAVRLRACAYKTTSLGSSAALLQLLLMNLPPSVNIDSPWTKNHVAVVMSGAWDASSQRDPREFLKRELPAFFRVVEKIRADPRTTQMRIIYADAPAIDVKSTGWRNNHAIAASIAYFRRELKTRPDLKVETLTYSYFQLSLSRLSETKDGVHYVRPGRLALRKNETDNSGDINNCQGPVGKAFTRLLMDHICSV